MVKINFPSTEKLVGTFYTKPIMTRKDVMELWNYSSTRSIEKLWRSAKDLQKEKGVTLFYASTIDTETAYEAWGIDIKKQLRRYRQLQKLEVGEENKKSPSVSQEPESDNKKTPYIE